LEAGLGRWVWCSVQCGGDAPGAGLLPAGGRRRVPAVMARQLAEWPPAWALRPAGDALHWRWSASCVFVPQWGHSAAVLAASGVWRVCSMGGDGGGRAPQICTGWRWVIVGCRSRATTLFGLNVGEGFRRMWSRPMRVWRLSMAVGNLGRPGAQVWRTYLVA
jgi:hypothetical protein